MADGEGEDPEDRTEDPTPRRLEKAREEGQVPLSREVVAFASLLAATLACLLTLPPLGADMLRAMRGMLALPSGSDAFEAAQHLLRASGIALLPILAAVVIAATLATLGQTGWPAKSLTLDFARLNPWTGLVRLFGLQSLGELLRTVLKLAAVGAALWLAADIGVLAASLMLPAGGLLEAATAASRALLIATLLAFGAAAALDLLWTRFQFRRRLRMSREELKEEMRENEGDPQLKARRRRIAEGRARRRMLAAIPKAAVVITNPTHYAVALAYTRGEAAAPRLVAKGVDAMAARIRAAAEAHGVPMVRDAPLARALYRLEPDTEIPPEHWQAVAEILAYVWRLRDRLAGSGPAYAMRDRSGTDG
jgi:flagellar biosynthetic protein FlhB